ncbi:MULTISPECIES: cupin domain-containing protein [unclassified Dyella]|jgi:quercetin dioxygenase-like cupin family protein|uniref:cupin domain-containing protein n=1 Tax=unclassified Dyella TaxID=2634549 RepID=UPI003F93C1AF
MRMFNTLGLLCLLACPAVITQQAFAQSSPAAPQAQVSDLMTKALKDYPGKEGKMILVTYPPGSVDPVHRHFAHAFVYVLEGSIVMSLNGGKEVTLGPGQTFYEGPEDKHTVGRNASTTQPAKFVVFLLKDQNKPILTPVQ